MAFGNITTLYLPTAANAGTSQWGSDVRKLLAAADAGSDATSKTDHSTGGAVTRTVDPYTTSTTDATQADYGWAVTPADMNSVAGAKRFMAAGNHVVTVRMGHNGATAVTATLLMYVYRIGPAAARTRTLLGSSSATFDLPLASGEVTATVTVALGEIIFDVDETLQYSFEVTCAGIVVTGRILTMFTGTQTVACRVVIPRLGVLADTTGSATGTGTATGDAGKVLGTVGTAPGSVVVSGVGASTAETTGTATGTGTASGLTSAVAGSTGTAVGSGTATGVFGAIGGMVGTADGVGTATGVFGATGGMVGSATGSGVASGVMGATGGMTGTAAGTGTALAEASSVAGTVGTATGTGTANGLASIVLGTVGMVGSDWPLNTPTKTIGGVTRDSGGGIVTSATVKLVRQGDDVRVATTTSHATTGAYSFTRGGDDPYTYRVVATKAGAPEIHGVSDELVPA